jgi:hypothetical protein
VVDIEDREGGPVIVATAQGVRVPDGVLVPRPVRWAAGGLLLVAADEEITDADAEVLADSVDSADSVDRAHAAGDLALYGRLLFGAAFGDLAWRGLVAAAIAAGEPYLEIAIRGDSGALHCLRWEALHDGESHVAARGAAVAGVTGRRLPVGIVRLVPSRGGVPVIRIELVPRVLFAIGCRLTDPQVRPGAEFMGIMRHLERNGGKIYPSVLESATRESLRNKIADFRPNIVHLIGHGRRSEGEVKLQLQADGPGRRDDYVTASELLRMLEPGPGGGQRMPSMVVLSACQAGAAGSGSGTSSFAATLVAGGVPVVVAMAGDIEDTACRVFTRALALAIEGGLPLVDAVIRGRRAAFLEGDPIESVDWSRPALFLDERVPVGEPLVDKAAIEAVRKRIVDLRLVDEPVFFGRADFIRAMDQMLDPGQDLKVLIAYTRDSGRRYGGFRLLQELAARAARDGCLPVLLGRFDSVPPRDWAALANALDEKLWDIRDWLGLAQGVECRAVTATRLPGVRPRDMVVAIREDLARLVVDLHAADPGWAGSEPHVMLLLHRVDLWGPDLLDGLIPLLGPQGIGSRDHPVPVVLTGLAGANHSAFHDAMEGPWRGPWVRWAPLEWFHSDEQDPEDLLAYQTWLLNPPDSEHRVFALKRGASPDWQAVLRERLELRGVLYHPDIFKVAAMLTSSFTSDRDDDLLASYEAVAHGC